MFDARMALLASLREAHSFDQGDGRRIWGAQVAPARVDASRVAAHLALADLFALPEPAVAGAQPAAL